MIRIKNINHNPQHAVTCKCGSWLNHWEQHGGGKRPTFCIVGSPDCLGKAEVGAFVQKANGYDDKWYIAPLCTAHSNNHSEELSVYNTWPLIEVDTIQACCCHEKKNLEPQKIAETHQV